MASQGLNALMSCQPRSHLAERGRADGPCEEVDVKRLIAGLAFLTSLAACLVTVGGGLLLLLIEGSGERGAGALLALAGAVTFAAAMVLIFAATDRFSGRSGRAVAVVAALLGVLPVAALSVAALRFSGFPLGSAVPLVDWPVFAAGLLFALGAVSILVMGIWRRSEAAVPRLQEGADLREGPDLRERLEAAIPRRQAPAPPMAPAPPAAPPPPEPEARHQPTAPPPEPRRREIEASYRPTGPTRSSAEDEAALRRALRIYEEEEEPEPNADDEVRVTPVELPSIAQFRRR